MPDEIVLRLESADSGRVHSSTDLRRPLAALFSVAAIALLVVGLMYASSASTSTSRTAGPSSRLAEVATTEAASAPPPVATTASTPAAAPAATSATESARAQAIASPRSTAAADTSADTSTETPADTAAPPVSTTPPTDAIATIGPLTRPVVVLYGDSLAWEARHAFSDSFADRPGVQVHTRTFGGTAICDWLDEMAADAASLAPGIVVVEFSGNSFTPCMHDANGAPLTGPAVEERYVADAATVIATFAPVGTHVVFAGAPVSGPNAAGVGRLNSHYRELADGHDGVWYSDAGSAVLADDSYTITLPCLSSEPCEGGYNSEGLPVNVVRSPDGVHFCPVSGDVVQGVTDNCPVWSSGAHRYGRALAQPALDALAAPNS